MTGYHDRERTTPNPGTMPPIPSGSHHAIEIPPMPRKYNEPRIIRQGVALVKTSVRTIAPAYLIAESKARAAFIEAYGHVGNSTRSRIVAQKPGLWIIWEVTIT